MIELGHIKVFTCEEVAERLGVTVRRIRSFIKKGQLKARRMGSTYCITERKLEEFLEGDSGANTSQNMQLDDIADDISRLDAILGENKITE
jgi:excisionase family DNA binding protein